MFNNRGTVFSLIILCLFSLCIFSVTATHAVEQSKGGPVLEPKVDRIVIGTKDFTLLAYSNGKILFDFQIATGVDTGPTPLGQFKIVSRLQNPWYTPDDEEAVEPGPRNPLGTRWLGINKPSYGLHGTKEPDSIGTRASEGCLRLHNSDIERLYRHVGKGTKVIIKKRIRKNLRTAQRIREDSHENRES